ncbi:MAG: hypothetical protein M3093_04645 [Thermoproteota archaeon]|nr:hypothetical protein [Thermoproteota archaeon]
MMALLSTTATLLLAGSAIFYQAAAQTGNQMEIGVPDDNLTALEELSPRNPLGPNILMAPHGEIPALNGSVNITRHLASFIISNANVSFDEAAATATNSVGNGIAIRGNLGAVQDFLAYTFQVMDQDGRLYMITVDAGNGQILHKSEPVQPLSGSPLIEMLKVEGQQIVIPGPHVAELFHYYPHTLGPLAKSVMPGVEEERLEVR